MTADKKQIEGDLYFLTIRLYHISNIHIKQFFVYFGLLFLKYDSYLKVDYKKMQTVMFTIP